MKKLLLLIVILALAPAPALAQSNSVSVEVDSGETCPSGWSTVDRSWSRPAKVFYVLPASLVAAYQLTHIGSGTPEFQVSPAFVIAVFPTDQLREAAYSSGLLRAQPAESGTVRRCTLP